MAGLFATYQPLYAAHRIPTFPVKDKRPAVRGYLKAGLPASSTFAQKFGDAEQFGFAVKSAMLTIVDIDAPDKGLLAAALAQYGETPIIVQSGSGNFQAWYSNGGEGRKIRPDKATPIDILGGGFVVAPPSRGANGDYTFIRGGLDDLKGLPVIKGNSIAEKRGGDCAPDYAQPNGSNSASIPKGKRNDALYRQAMRLAASAGSGEELISMVSAYNAQSLSPPLPDSEVVSVASSAWGYETRGQNKFGREQRVELAHSEIEALWNYPEAMMLLLALRRQHWGRGSFVVANAMAGHMPGGGMRRQRFTKARTDLESLGFIKMVRAATRHEPAEYRLGKAF